jgi:hypothetical protein
MGAKASLFLNNVLLSHAVSNLLAQRVSARIWDKAPRIFNFGWLQAPVGLSIGSVVCRRTCLYA